MRKTPKTIALSLIASLEIKKVEPLSLLIRELDEFYQSVRQTRFFKTVKEKRMGTKEKSAILDKALSMLPFGPECQATLQVLVKRNQMGDLPGVIASLKEIRHREFKVDEAEVITVRPLTSEQRKRAEKALSKISGTEVLVREKINPAILGGLVFKLGDSVIDASLIRKIVEMRKKLTA